MEWTQSAIADLRTLWNAGHSTAEIGRRMGITKNMVIGKSRREGLDRRASPINGEARTEQARERRAAQVKQAAEMHGAGYTSRQIGARLGIRAETAGALLRGIGLASHGRKALPAGAGLEMTARRVMEAREASTPALPPAPVAAHPLMRAGATGCRFPFGEPRTPSFRYCDAPAVVRGRPYCAACCAVAYTAALVPVAAFGPGRWVQ